VNILTTETGGYRAEVFQDGHLRMAIMHYSWESCAYEIASDLGVDYEWIKSELEKNAIGHFSSVTLDAGRQTPE